MKLQTIIDKLNEIEELRHDLQILKDAWFPTGRLSVKTGQYSEEYTIELKSEEVINIISSRRSLCEERLKSLEGEVKGIEEMLERL